MRQKIDLGLILVALGALGLLVSLFLDWYSGASAFDAFEIVDWALAFCAVAALYAVGMSLREAAVPPAWLTAVVLAALALVVSQLIDPPPAAAIHHHRETGAWLALGSVLVMGLSLALAAASISITIDVRGRERRRRVAAVDRRDAAAAAPPPPPAPPPPAPRFTRDPERTEPLRPLDPRPPEGSAE